MTGMEGEVHTFLFTDIEGSTRLWEEHARAMQEVLARHDALLRRCIDEAGGATFKTVGDAFCAVFEDPGAAADAAVRIQTGLQNEAWPPEIGALRVRIALHTGPAENRDRDYFGPTLNRIARLLAAGHGGQVLLSERSAEQARYNLPSGSRLEPLGAHKLRDLQRPESIYQLSHPGLGATFPPLRTLSTLPNNLPQQTTSFIGRERESGQVKRLIESARLVTLTGPGGCGKTRLSLQVAADLLPTFPDGVFLIELAPLNDPGLVPQVMAGALGVREEPGRAMVDSLCDWLKARNLLLLLDNCEHLLDACAHLANTLQRACPNVHLLASSREALGISGETVYPTPTLGLPDPHESVTPESALNFEAVRLFADRASSALPRFAVGSNNAQTVARLCQRLDGIPLAIELAAARVRAMSVEQIAARLDDRFRLLTGGSRTALPHQQTLRALMDWSYNLLSSEEKTLLRRLAVFHGGWTLEAAEATCSDERVEPWQVLDLMVALVEKSLVVYDEGESRSRYRLLETIRQYALEHQELEDTPDDLLALRRRHRDYFRALAEDFEERRLSPEMAGLLVVLDIEYDNLRATLEFCQRDAPSVPSGLRMVWALWTYWQFRGHFAQGREWIEALLSHPAAGRRTRERADALFAGASVAFRQNDITAARRFADESLAIHRETGHAIGLASALNMQGIIASRQGDFDLARAAHSDALVMFRSLKRIPGILSALSNLGMIEEYRGDYAAACAAYDEAREKARELQEPGSLAVIAYNCGWAALRLDNQQTARSALREAVAVAGGIGHRVVTARALAAASVLLARRGESEGAGRLWGAAETAREAINLPPDEDILQDLETARRGLDDAGFWAGEASGRALSLEDAAALVEQLL